MKSAQRYERIAGLADAAGYPKVTGPAVHSWLKAGLLPKALVRHPDFGVKVFDEPAGLREHLLALCRYRYDRGIRDLGLIALMLWLDGYPIPQDAIRAGLISVVERPVKLVARVGWRAARSDPRNRLSAIDDTATRVVYEHELAQRMGHSKADRPQLASGLADYLALLLGKTLTIVEASGLEELGRLAGIDAQIDASKALAESARGLNVADLGERIRNMSGDALEEARRVGMIALERFRSTEHSLSGALVTPEARVLTVAAALAFPDASAEFTRSLNDHSG